MSKNGKVRSHEHLASILLAVITSLVMALGFFTPAQASTKASSSASATLATNAAWDSVTGAKLDAWACNSGDFCAWNGFGGTGSRCAWDVADPDWTSGAIVCSWAARDNVKSMYDNGNDSSYTGVVYFRDKDFHGRIGCTRRGHRDNTSADGYKIRSHEWTRGSCG